MGRASSFLLSGEHINIGWHSGYRGVERFRKCDYHIVLTADLKKHIVKQGIKCHTSRKECARIFSRENKCLEQVLKGKRDMVYQRKGALS